MKKKEIESKIKSYHKSTCSVLGFFSPWHDKLRQKCFWYQNWHMKRYAGFVHWVVFFVVVFIVLYFTALLFAEKYQSEAGGVSNSLKQLTDTWIRILNDFMGK